jgi:hypothetical protein
MSVPIVANMVATIICMAAGCLLALCSSDGTTMPLLRRQVVARQLQMSRFVCAKKIQPHHLLAVRLKRWLSSASACR